MKPIICPGFKAAGVHAGLKKNHEKDLGLIYSEVLATVAGVFTTNQVKAAPVLLDMQRSKTGRCQRAVGRTIHLSRSASNVPLAARSDSVSFSVLSNLLSSCRAAMT